MSFAENSEGNMQQEQVTSTCAHCQKPFSYPKPKRGRLRKWCSHKCRGRHQRRDSAATINGRHVLECVICSAVFTAKRDFAKACSKECRKRWLAVKQAKTRRAHVGTCKLCGMQFTGDPDRTVCSKECRGKHNNARRQHNRSVAAAITSIDRELNRINAAITKAIGPARKCKDCGAVLTHRYARACDTCRRTKKRSDKTHRSRARRLGVHHEHVANEAVFSRDLWRCQHCGCRCHRPTGAYSTREATLDHIVPMSKGGPHTYENTQLLCRQCNTKKSNRMSRQEQLRMIG